MMSCRVLGVVCSILAGIVGGEDLQHGQVPSVMWQGLEIPIMQTPFGNMPRACVHEHGPDLKYIDGDTLMYVNGTTRPRKGASYCSHPGLKQLLGYPRRMESSPRNYTGYRGYFLSAHAKLDPAHVGQTQLGLFSANYILPAHNPKKAVGQIDYWIGSEPVTGGSLTVHQPVVSWTARHDPSGHGQWIAASWNCCPKDQAHTGNTVHGVKTNVAGIIKRSVEDGKELFSIETRSDQGTSTLKVASQGRIMASLLAVQEIHHFTDDCDEFPKAPDSFDLSGMSIQYNDSTEVAHTTTWDLHYPSSKNPDPSRQLKPLYDKCGGNITAHHTPSDGVRIVGATASDDSVVVV